MADPPEILTEIAPVAPRIVDPSSAATSTAAAVTLVIAGIPAVATSWPICATTPSAIEL